MASIFDGIESVTVLNKYEYDDFDMIKNITLHSNIVNLGTQTFRYCKNLKRIDVSNENKLFSSVDGVLFDKDKEVLICYPAAKIGAEYVVPKTVKRIESYAFARSRLHNVQLNEGILEIGNCAFEGCSNLTEINLPKTVQSLGTATFQGCEKIKHFYIPKSLKYIKFPSLPDLLDTIEVDEDHSTFCTFDGILFNKNMSELLRMPGNYSADRYDVPSTVKRIESCAFGQCEKVKTFFIPENVDYIGDYAFAYNNTKQTILMPKTLYESFSDDSSPLFLSKAKVEVY